MKSNPFYALSASAMLLGCWMLSQALQLEAGKLQGLLLLMLVLQVYEGLLVGLGSLLVRSKRAPRDGLSVLAIESVFLMDAALLSAECVTTDRALGTLVAIATMALAFVKLAWVRRAVPGLLSRKAAAILGAQAAACFVLPVAAAHLADARLLSPVVLYGFWWMAAALPVLKRILSVEAGSQGARPAQALALWSWMPSSLVLLHLWTVGYIHTVDFRAPFLAPFLLGLAVTAPRERLARQLLLPAVAVLMSLGNADLFVHIFGMAGLVVSPLRLALAGAGIAWAYLAWRDRNRWLIALATCGGVFGLLGSTALRLLEALADWLVLAVPRDIFDWGTLALIAAFVLLAAGLRRSLHGEPQWPVPRRGAGPEDPSTGEGAAGTEGAR
jgi:hypothetical protein